MNLQALPEEALKEILSLTEAKKKLDLREVASERFRPCAQDGSNDCLEASLVQERVRATQIAVRKSFQKVKDFSVEDVSEMVYLSGDQKLSIEVWPSLLTRLSLPSISFTTERESFTELRSAVGVTALKTEPSQEIKIRAARSAKAHFI